MILAVAARILLAAVIIAALLTLAVVGSAVALMALLDYGARRRLHRHDVRLLARSRA